MPLYGLLFLIFYMHLPIHSSIHYFIQSFIHSFSEGMRGHKVERSIVFSRGEIKRVLQ